MPLPNDFHAVLVLLRRAFEQYRKLAGSYAVLFGGAAVCISTDGGFLSGDFDVVAALDDAFDVALTQQGFCREDRKRRLKRGYYHPRYPEYGVEAVSGPLFEGLTDTAKMRVVTLSTDSADTLASIEDLIADRLGQHAANPTHTDMLAQARLLYKLGGALDLPYLRKRIVENTGDPALIGL